MNIAVLLTLCIIYVPYGLVQFHAITRSAYPMEPHPPRGNDPAADTGQSSLDGESVAKVAAADGPPGDGPRTVTSAELLRGGRELRIAHGDDVYRLLLTRTGKLLLQK